MPKDSLMGKVVENSVIGAALGIVLMMLIPSLLEDNRQHLKEQSSAFRETMEAVASKNLESAKANQEMVTSAIQQMREDEQEDRRLFVEILRRSDLTSDEISAAVEAAAPSGS